MTTEQLMQAAAQYGLPTVLLVGFLWFIKRGIWAAAAYLAPLAAQASERFVKHLDSIEILGNGLLDQQKAQTELMKDHRQVLQITHGNTEKILEAVRKKETNP